MLGALAGAALLSACQVEREPTAPGVKDNSASPEPRLPIIEPPLDRKALLRAVVEVRSAYATGQEITERQRQLDGQRVELRLSIGCPGDTQPTRRIDYRENDRRLRITIAPEITAETVAVAELGLSDIEAVEGFWIYRPWVIFGDCPVIRQEGSPSFAAVGQKPQSVQANTAPEPPRIGIAQFYSAADSRTGRRGMRDYEASRQLADDEAPRPDGYQLVISGRLEALPDGRVIVCSGSGVAVPPRCIISAHIDRVSVVDPANGSALGEWSPS